MASAQAGKYLGFEPEPIYQGGDDPQWQLISNEFYVRDVAGKEIAIFSGTSLTQWNIWGLDQVGEMHSDTTKYYYLKDHLGSIRTVINSTNTIVSAQDYDAWGYLLENRTYQSNNTRYKFTNKERDNESNYDYFGARYYDARIGRWGGVDPLFDKHIDWTPYNYVLCKPLTLVDPTGKQVEITIRTYIPQESSTNPLYHVMHDNRHADYNSSSYRTEQRFVVEPNKNVSENAIKEYSSDIGTTIAFPLLKPEDVQIKKGAGNLPEPTATRITESSVSISVTGEAWETLLPFFNINYNANFSVTENQDGSYTIISEGTEDGFPSYEIWAKNLKTGGNPLLLYNRENENVIFEIGKLAPWLGDIDFRTEGVVR